MENRNWMHHRKWESADTRVEWAMLAPDGCLLVLVGKSEAEIRAYAGEHGWPVLRREVVVTDWVSA